MAISAYGKALASMAKESVLGSVKGFASDVKSAALSEMPAFTGAVAFARSLRKEAEKYQKETEKSNDEIKDEVKKQVKETRVGNVIGIESAKLLKSINANTVVQTRLMLQQAKFERQSRMFAEEESRERLLEQRKLLNAIRKIGMAGSGVPMLPGGGGGGGGGLFSGIGSLLESALSGAAGLAGAFAGHKAYKGGKYLLNKYRGPKPEVLGSAKRNPALAGRAAGATTARVAGSLLPRILGGFLTGPVGWGLLAYTVYEILDSIFDFDLFSSSAEASTTMPSSPGTTPGTPGTGGAGRGQMGRRRRLKPPTSSSTSSTSSQRGEFIRQKEGKRLTAYSDAGSYSIGYGYNIKKKDIEKGYIDLGNGEKVPVAGEGGRDTRITDDQAERLFQLTLNTKEQEIISQLGAENYNKLSEEQKEAILSYYYNVGRLPGRPGQFAAAIKANKFGEARELILKGVATSQGKVLPALQQRRKEEAQLFGNFKSSAKGGKPGPKIVSSPVGSTLAEMMSRVAANAEAERSSVVSGGGSVVPTKAVIPVEDEKLIRITEEQTEAIKKIESSSNKTLVETRQQNANLRATRRVETRGQRIAREANERFLAGFQALTTTKITSAIEKALFPKGYGVTAEETRSDELYRGQRLGDLLGTSRFFNRTFGSEYGPLFDQLSRSYLELGATNVGQFLFGGTKGVDAQALTGQILGNIQQGRKDVALEQLLYGMTGTSSGFETLFAKYGFGSAQQGVTAMGNVLGAGATDIVRRNLPFIGEVPGQTMYTDPVTGKQVPYGGLGNITTIPFKGKNALAVVNVNEIQPGVSTTAAASGAGRTTTYGDPSEIYGYGYGEELVQVNTDTNKTLTNQHNEQLSYLEKVHDDDRAWTENSDKIRREGAAVGASATMAAAQATGNVFTRGIEWLGSIFTSSAGRGGGTNLNIGFGGGGQPTFGNFLMDLGKTAAISSLTKNISNPYAKAIANFGLNRVADVGIQTIMSGGNLATFGSNLSTAFNIPQIASFLGFGTTAAAASWTSATAATAAAAKGVTGLTVGAGSGTAIGGGALGTGLTAGAGGATGITAAGTGGTVVGGGSAAAAGGSTLGSTFTALATNPVTWIVLGALLLFGSKKKSPIAVHKVIPIAGNSNIDLKVTVFTRRNPPKEYYDAADQFLNVAFNTTKMLEIRTGKRAPFDYIYMRVESDRVEIDYGLGQVKEHLKSTGALEGKRLGGGIHTVQMTTVARQIADHIAEKFKTASSEDTEKIQKGIEELGKKSFKSITSGIEASVAKDLNLAPSSTESGEYARELQAQNFLREFQGPSMEMISSGEDSYSTGERLIYDMRTGKMIKQSETGFGVTEVTKPFFDSEGQSSQITVKEFDQNIIGINKQGKPIYNVGGSAIDIEDMQAMIDADPSVLTSVTPAPGTIPKAETVAPQGPTLTQILAGIAANVEIQRASSGGVTVVSTDNSSQSVTNNTTSVRGSASDAIVFGGAPVPT